MHKQQCRYATIDGGPYQANITILEWVDLVKKYPEYTDQSKPVYMKTQHFFIRGYRGKLFMPEVPNCLTVCDLALQLVCLHRSKIGCGCKRRRMFAEMVNTVAKLGLDLNRRPIGANSELPLTAERLIAILLDPVASRRWTRYYIDKINWPPRQSFKETNQKETKQ